MPRRLSKAPDAYHHGDLRRALIEVAVRVIKKDGVNALSLRRAAREAGVSHTAPKHHFGDLRGLLAAIAAEGFRRLRARMQSEDELPLQRLKQVGTGYVGFATSNPCHFRVMYHPTLGDKEGLDQLQEEMQATFQHVVATIEACQEGGFIRAGDSRMFAMLAWSTVHGFAALSIDDQVHGNGVEGSVDELVDQMTTELFLGLRAQ